MEPTYKNHTDSVGSTDYRDITAYGFKNHFLYLTSDGLTAESEHQGWADVDGRARINQYTICLWKRKWKAWSTKFQAEIIFYQHKVENQMQMG